jgi:CRISPR-associated endonuclease Cas1/CRISPR-associated protein Cas4
MIAPRSCGEGALMETVLVPARMINELSYCPRLFALEWLHREWADSGDTVEGRTVHRRVDQETGAPLPEPEDDGERPVVVRSVLLGDPTLGMIARIDFAEAAGGAVVPVDYKRGSPPDIPEGAWEPERVQVCAQGLLLRAHGYTSDHGVLYFAAARRRVEVRFDDALIARTLALRDEALAIARAPQPPPPLVDSPKCNGCSLVGICLPDEHNLLTGRTDVVRPLMPARDDGAPLYVRTAGASLGKDANEIVVKEKGQVVARARLEDTSRVVLLGNVGISTPLLRELAWRDIPVAFHSSGGWHFGTFAAVSGHNVVTRIAQHRTAADPARSLSLAKSFVRAKILNSRVLLRRNGLNVPSETLLRLKELSDDVAGCESLESLLGVEGSAARFYFQSFSTMIKGPLRAFFQMDGRNRRPPRDPVNALLSFAYACLAREITAITAGLGLDPYVGFMHQPRFGRASLALDLMEEFRPVIADSVVINAINNAVVDADDFLIRPTGVSLKDNARPGFVEVFERRMDEVATHPRFDTRLSYRRILELQARFLGKVLLGEIADYPEYRVR